MGNDDAEDGQPIIIYIIAGCIAGVIEATATWPTEYIKTKLQLQKQSQEHLIKCRAEFEKSRTTPEVEVAYEPPLSCERAISLEIVQSVEDVILDDPPLILLPYTDMISGVLYTIKTLGFFALYYGLTPTLLGSIPKAGIRFGMFSWLTRIFQDEDGTTSIEMTFLAGCLAGVVEALIVVVPVETIKTKCIQLDKPFLEGLKQIILLEGIGGVYTGGLATVIKQSSNHGLRFVWYSEYKRMVTHDGEYELTPIMALFGGITAGIFSALGNQPADVIKTRMQGVGCIYTSTWDCIRKTYADEGFAGFYTGIIPRLARVVPGQGILFVSYEMISSALLSCWLLYVAE